MLDSVLRPCPEGMTPAVNSARAVARPPARMCIVLPGLGAGGTEHVVNILANEWIARGWSVTLITLEPPNAAPYYHFHPDVEFRNLGLPPRKGSPLKAVLSSVRRVRAMRQALKASRPDVVLSFLTRTNVMALIAARGLAVPVVVSERNNPELQTVGPVWERLRRHLYPRAFGLVTMTAGALEHFAPAMRRRGWVIPNAVDLPHAGPRRRRGRTLTAVGRLVPQKGFDLLLPAFAQIAGDFPAWRLVIWGEGPERAALEAQRDDLALAGRVEMPGITPRAGTWVDDADVFVLSSRFEGWGIVLLEAMAADLPVVSFDCQWGPREMIEDGVNGLLVERENVAALAEALRRLLGDEALRVRLAAAGGASARRLTPEHVVDRWDEVAFAALESRQLQGVR